jgi:hypothetical protein
VAYSTVFYHFPGDTGLKKNQEIQRGKQMDCRERHRQGGEGDGKNNVWQVMYLGSWNFLFI